MHTPPDPADSALSRLLRIHRALETDTTPSDSVDELDTAVRPRQRLPPGGPVGMRLADALADRRSRYDFGARALELETAGTLLHTALGLSRRVRTPKGDERALSRSPSAGGLGSVRAYLAARSVRGVEAGVHRYLPEAHELEPVADARPDRAAAAYLQPEFAERAAATIILTVDVRPGLARYGVRHYRVMHVDVGIAAQSLYLVATGLGLAACAVAGFREHEVRAWAGLARTELPVLLFPVGPPRDRPAEPSTGGQEDPVTQAGP